jgi:hypothetical protein
MCNDVVDATPSPYFFERKMCFLVLLMLFVHVHA